MSQKPTENTLSFEIMWPAPGKSPSADRIHRNFWARISANSNSEPSSKTRLTSLRTILRIVA